MKVACIYTESRDYHSTETPLVNQSKIPFGLASVASHLNEADFCVDIYVITPKTDLRKIFGTHLRANDYQLFCMSSVTSEYGLTGA